MDFNKLALNGFFKMVALPVMMASVQAEAASISFYLDQSNDLADGINYAQVTISDSATIVGDIDFTVEILDSAFTVSGDNFGLQNFSFNYDPSLTIDTSNVVTSDWSVSEGKNAGGGFGKFGLQLSGDGGSRTDILNFSIAGVVGDSLESYALSSILSPSTGEYFAAHIAGFDETNGVTSAQFAGSTSVVPVPAAVWLFGSGLIGLVSVARRKA